MIVVAGALYVAEDLRASYLVGCVDVVRQARESVGCVDFALSADLVDPRRINVFEQWSSSEDLAAFRGSGPSDDQNDAIEHADIRELYLKD